MLEETEEWARARRARDQLTGQLLHHPEVSLIDIGRDPAEEGAVQGIALRVHLRHASTGEALNLPAEIDGIPVRVVFADYRLE